MGLNRIREDSVAALRKKKTTEELQAENEKLHQKAASLEGQLTDTQLALCDVYEQLVVVASTGEV